jgi:hypothetical protein
VAGIYPGIHASASLQQKYLFADSTSGAILTVPADSLSAGQPVPADSYENRTLDFKPDAGSLAHPILIFQAGSNGGSMVPMIYILDRDGDLFAVSSG